MPVWHSELKLTDLWRGPEEFDDSPENIERVAGICHERMKEHRARVEADIKRGGGEPDMDEYDAIEDEFHSIHVIHDLNNYAWFESLMENLYDWADDQRVWIA